jgi:hypothetical protein
VPTGLEHFKPDASRAGEDRRLASSKNKPDEHCAHNGSVQAWRVVLRGRFESAMSLSKGLVY